MSFYGLLGAALGHSLSPAIHKYLFRHLELTASYSLFSVASEQLAAAMDGLKLLGAGGVNVTVPYKRQIIPLLDELDPAAARLGAVNTIAFYQGRTVGYNTDYTGFGIMLDQAQVGVRNKTAVVLGSGGAARMAAYWLSDHGCSDVKLVSRSQPEPATEFAVIDYAALSGLSPTDLLVNATPVGMYPDIGASPLIANQLAPFATVIDLIYNPQTTCLLKLAYDQGSQTVNGLSMLVAQAVAAQEIWQQRRIDYAIINEIIPCLLVQLNK